MPPFRSETDDINRLVALYGQTKFGRCAGWRLVMPGSPCPHCHSVNPLVQCLAPGPSREQRAAEMLRG